MTTTTGANWCPMCGMTIDPHDDEACDAKMAAWNPRGIDPDFEADFGEDSA